MMSVVDDALTAVSVGVRDDGVTGMHDATECGVWGGLYEIAQASGVGMRIEQERVPVRDDVRRICEHFDMDPYTSISEGTLLITCRPGKAGEVVQALAAKNIAAAVVGEVTPRPKGCACVSGGDEHALEHPRVDPFWAGLCQGRAGVHAVNVERSAPAPARAHRSGRGGGPIG